MYNELEEVLEVSHHDVDGGAPDAEDELHLLQAFPEGHRVGDDELHFHALKLDELLLIVVE